MTALPTDRSDLKGFFASRDQQSDLEEKLEDIFSNLYYTWDKDLYAFIDKLDSYNWRKTKSPSVIIHRYLEEHKIPKEEDLTLIENGISAIRKYLNDVTWCEEHCHENKDLLAFSQHPIAYFCAEYGLVDWLQIYSGGLGVLAGDFIKEASDYGLPILAIGLFYHEGYFHQNFDSEGIQNEHYIPQDPAASMLTLVRDKEENPVEVSVTIEDHEVYVRGWELKVGHRSIYLLDTNFEKNEKWEDRMITAHLYGGDEDTRIRQEIVLGIGGYRFIQNIGIHPSVIHLNEGHASFVVLEKMNETDTTLPIEDRFDKAKSNILFTNHTLNAAGNDKFEFSLIEKYMKPYADALGIDIEALFGFGNDQLYSKSAFSMTILGLKGSRIANAVSLLHGEATKRLWPDYPMEAITNGVHMPTWVAGPYQQEFEKYVDMEWKNPTASVDWEKINDIPDETIWQIHNDMKKLMIERINSTLGSSLDQHALTIIWTRRFAAYKRPDMFLQDIERLSEIVNHAERPVQFLIGGKAHPRDTLGKQLLQKVISITQDSRFKNKIVFLKGYNWNLARYVMPGADVWLNNPIRFEEASGTSGMKAGANGVLQFTTLDGWTDEVNWEGKGWVLPQEHISSQIYEILSNQIAPLYYANEAYPREWVSMMKETMKACLSHYNMGRMLEEYIQLYSKLAH
ncbi:alpha-glucan family phosphorylase [Candidatus Dojkabacteria bacterium]|uniref:Alpha-glucan family phosphorylase n=1 Tax=Candidatus Dojkabacteria bacterium TaxID=2099670 RepID=A0A955L785_9BACT|nr:alpha-glucan family phosphorylase [Candidatus Dojkabacteria bacterium]